MGMLGRFARRLSPRWRGDRTPAERSGVGPRGVRQYRVHRTQPPSPSEMAVPPQAGGQWPRLLLAPLLFLLAATSSSCGFTPLYATSGEGIRSEMRGVRVGAVTGPPDAAYYAEDALRDVLPGTGAAQYDLRVQLRDQRRAVAVTRQANTTRFDYVLNARYSLRNLETDEVRQNTIQTVVSYGVVESQYASLVGREDAVRRAALDLARRVETDVALYLKGRAPETSRVPLAPVLDDADEREGLSDFDEDDFDGDEAEGEAEGFDLDEGETPGIGADPEDEAVDAPSPAGR